MTATALVDRGVLVVSPAEPESGALQIARGLLLARVLDVLDRDGLPYCILHGHEHLPQRVRSDVDMLLPREMLPKRLAELLRTNERTLGIQIVQWFADGAHFIVLAARGETDGEPPVLLQLHVSTDFEVSDRVVFSGNEILRSRRRSASGLWIPSAGKEFACVLANRLNKLKLDNARAARLSDLWAEDEEKCRRHLGRLLPAGEAEIVAKAAASGDWTPVRQSILLLSTAMRRRLMLREPVATLARFGVRHLRRLDRWAWPQCGLHVVFLGPDGVGKSTVIDAVRDRISPAFLQSQYQTFARGLLPTRPKKSPHALPPRSLGASMIKAAWWLLAYGPGYFRSVHPTLARGGLAINHRYLCDAVVDPHRYRYSGPTKLIQWIWRIVPKPDLIIFLDAPVEVICRRKQELLPDELAELRWRYLALADKLPNARVVSTDQPMESTVEDVTEIIFRHLSRRIARRPNLS